MRVRRLPRNDRGFTAFVALSVALHLSVLVLGKVWHPSETRILPVYNVTLVTSVPGGGKRAEAPVAKGDPDVKSLAEPAQAKAAPEPAPKSEPAKAEPVKKAVETRAVPKAVAKKADAKAAKARDAKPAAKADAKNAKAGKAKEESLSDAMAAVKGMLKDKQRGAANGMEGAERREIAEFGGGGDGPQVGALAVQIYGGQIQAAIQRRWTIPGELAKRPLAVQLGIKVDASGKLIDVWIDKGSGFSAFDESALRAVRAAGDFPAPPLTKNGYFEIYTRFTPEGARSN